MKETNEELKQQRDSIAEKFNKTLKTKTKKSGYEIQAITPEGVLQWPSLHEPSKFGSYGTKLILSAKEAKPLFDLIQEMYGLLQGIAEEEGLLPKPGKKLKLADEPWQEEFEGEGKDAKPTGNYIFNFKRKAEIKKKDGTTIPALAPFVVNAKQQPISKSFNISTGSSAKLAASLKPYVTPKLEAGISLQLLGAQITNLVQFNGGMTIESLGFEDEDGFDGGQEDQTPSKDDNSTGEEEDF